MGKKNQTPLKPEEDEVAQKHRLPINDEVQEYIGEG
jgi:hypothetical protein